MEKLKIVACSPPGCNCPTLTVEENVDGRDLVTIVDDYNGIVIMEVAEFMILVEKFSKEYECSNF